MGSAISALLLYPLERARVEMMQQSSSSGISKQKQQEPKSVRECIRDLISRQELYRGCLPMTIALTISQFVFFYAHQVTKRRIVTTTTSSTTSLNKNNAARALLASSLAGVINVILTNPLWVAVLRLQTLNNNNNNNKQSSRRYHHHHDHQPFKALFVQLYKIATKEGIRTLWSGTSASLLLVSNPAIQLFVYDRLKMQYLTKKSTTTAAAAATTTGGLGPIDAFVIGAVSKTVATLVTYPIQLAQVVLRLQRKSASLTNSSSSCHYHHHHHTGESSSQSQQEALVDDDDGKKLLPHPGYNNTFDCIMKLYGKGGWGALYSGIDAKLLQTVFTAALTFLTYEQILTVVRQSVLLYLKNKKV